MIVCRDLETGPMYPSIGSAPSIGTLGISLSVTTFMKTLLVLDEVQGIRIPMQFRGASVAMPIWRRRADGARGMEGAGKSHGAK
jgi:hypothetical protein